VRVQLLFGAEADLDLYVTDPALETIYFANTPAKLGGTLEADLRCDAAPPRIETVLLPAAPPGRYRVGVDFPERCDRSVDRVHFVVRVEGAGLRFAEESEVPFGRFLSRVLELDVTDGGSPRILTPPRAPGATPAGS
jgi:uncharacterized protein YfaP (DUF2135 family)